jgi:hypothetical protein
MPFYPDTWPIFSSALTIGDVHLCRQLGSSGIFVGCGAEMGVRQFAYGPGRASVRHDGIKAAQLNRAVVPLGRRPFDLPASML